MRVLVTGGAGFVGSHTVDQLIRRGYEVCVLDALMPPVHVPRTVPKYVPVDVDFIQGDVCLRSTWERALEGVEAVFHLAAYQDYLTDFSTFFHTNAVGTALLYEIIVQQHMDVRKVIVASSQAVYGEGKYRCSAGAHGRTISTDRAGSPGGLVSYPPLRADAQLQVGNWEVRCPDCGEAAEPIWTDEDVVNPHNQYAISKYAQEMIALNLGRRYGIPTVCLRYSIVQGARQSFRNAYSGVLRIFSQRLLNGKPPICYEDGHQLRDYVSVHDVVQANMIALENPLADNQVYNVGGNRKISVLEYATLIARRAGVSIEPVVPGIYRFGDTRHVFSAVTKLRELGWEPVVSLEAIVDEYLAWATSQPDFGDYSTQAGAEMTASGAIRAIRN
jgi:dTDP-L-rhamnose 4-epimerase